MSSQDENQVANLIGSHAYYEMASCVSISLCYGVALSLFYASLRVSTGNNARPPTARKFLLILTCFMFLMNSGLVTTHLGYSFLLFSWAGDPVNDSTPSLDDRQSAVAAAGTPFDVCQLLFEIVNFIVGDAIVIWRAAVLWQNSSLVRGGLCILLLGDIAVSLCDLIIGSIAIVRSTGTDFSWINVDTARILASVGVNFLATLCIAVKAWQFRHTVRLGFSQAATKRLFVNQVLTLMVECGLIFCIVQFVYAIYMLVIAPLAYVKPFMDPLSISQAVLQPLFALFAGMYPSLIILVMARQQSIFGTSTLVVCSQSTLPSNETDMHSARGLSTLHFATVQEASRQSDTQSQSIGGNIRDSSKDGTHVVFAEDAEKAV